QFCVVHSDIHKTRCAGVGRTGVFIALDHLTQHINDHDFVDIYGLVAELRSERMCMVQNLVSYLTVQAVSAPKFLQRRCISSTNWEVSVLLSGCESKNIYKTYRFFVIKKLHSIMALKLKTTFC
uniref:Uncharacterized protein n=1 Tax=Sus scrofa TaxID=9823 RepID=A0A8D1B5Z6_PIG